MEQKGAHSAESLKSRVAGAKIKRWDGRTRTTVPWDGIRRDAELWFEKGNCLIHLYAKGHSRRGPSFRVSVEQLQAAGFEAIFSMYFNEVTAKPGSKSSTSFDGIQKLSRSALCEIYIPAPDYSSKDDSFAWHITTRNFFAFLCGKQLVGGRLSKTLIDLQERLHLFRPEDPHNQSDLMAYLERMGYLEFAHCPDYSLALLSFAEFYEMSDLWIDAFVHCVGMNGMLVMSQEFERTSRVTKALITRAYLEMDLHMARVTKALSCFLEDDFSSAHLGLSNGARAHLDRFRSFLHTYYVEKFGYWPPPKGTIFSKALCKSMYFDFRSLYDFLVDLDSNDLLQDQKPASGGICVLQNVQAFDRRHKYIPLPHPHPLLPNFDPQRSQSQRALMSLKLGMKQAKTERYVSARDALFAATNSADIGIANAPLVRAYKRFERQCTLQPGEKVSLSDGRKVRWMLIYGIIQMLVSVIRAPKEVRDVESPAYPLCCLVAGTLPWKGGAKSLNDFYTESINLSPPVSPGNVDGSLLAKPLPSAPQVSIQPDCAGDEYFGSHTNIYSSPTPPAPRHSTTGPTTDTAVARRRASIFRNQSFRSVKAISLSTFSTRRNSQTIKSPPPNFCEILVHGYGNGLNQTTLDSQSVTPSELSTEILPEIVVSQSTAVASLHREPMLRDNHKRRTAPGRLITSSAPALPESTRSSVTDGFEVDKAHEPPALEDVDSPVDNANSAPLTPVWTRSNSRSSARSEDGGSQVERHASKTSVFSTNSTLVASPVEPPNGTSSGITIQRTFSVNSFVAKEINIFEALRMPTDGDEPVQVYQPSGAPLKKRDTSFDLRGISNASSAKGGLKRSDAVANKSKRHSLRMKDQGGLFDVMRIGPAAVV